jgi:DNA polymerase III alpha subunit
MPDIDIDFADRDFILGKLKHRVAKLDTGKKHNTGIYATEIPHNPIDNLSTIDYETAEERGYFKLDFLNVSIYTDVRDEAHLLELMKKEPLWELLTEPDFSNNLFHVAGHSTILKEMKPQSIPQLAAVLAMIRPAKRNLVGQPWDTVMKEVWTKPEDGSYFFKKAHAMAYAVGVVVHMNLICEKISAQQVGS